MTEVFLYDTPIIPEDFKFPDEYISLAKNNSSIRINDWRLLFNDMATSLSYYGAMLIKYKDKPLIPFAILPDELGREDDGLPILACFDGDDRSGDPKVYFHDYGFSEKGISWDKRNHLKNFSDWLKYTKNGNKKFKLNWLNNKG